MTTLQGWIIIGIPVVVMVAALFTGRSTTRATLGYLVMAAGFVAFVTYVDSTISAAVLGTFGALMVASGRGATSDDAEPEHHDNRQRYTTTAGG